MTALGQDVIRIQQLFQIGRLVIFESGELAVAPRRAELDPPRANARERFQRPRNVLGEFVSKRVYLGPRRDSHRLGPEVESGSRQRVSPEESPSRKIIHAPEFYHACAVLALS